MTHILDDGRALPLGATAQNIQDPTATVSTEQLPNVASQTSKAATAPSTTPEAEKPAPATQQPLTGMFEGLDQSFADKIAQLIAASGGRLRIASGYRDNATQAKLYAQAVQKYGEANAGNWVAPPGHSNHNRGMAVDLAGDIDLAHQLAPQFGLEFPMSWEPWHIEPQGLRKTAAPAAYTNGPAGTVNPVHDMTLDSTPHNLLATLSNAMSGRWLGDPTKLPGADNSQTETAGGGLAAFPTSTTGVSAGQVSESPGASLTGAPGTPLAPSPSRDAYIKEILPYAEAQSKRTGIPVEVFIVQSGMETGWGTSGWWRNNHNPAGIGVTGQAGAGNSYPDLNAAFEDYANKLLGHGEAGQEPFVQALQNGADARTLLGLIQQSPWAAGHYGGGGLTATYDQLYPNGTRQPLPQAPKPAPTQTSASHGQGRVS